MFIQHQKEHSYHEIPKIEMLEQVIFFFFTNGHQGVKLPEEAMWGYSSSQWLSLRSHVGIFRFLVVICDYRVISFL